MNGCLLHAQYPIWSLCSGAVPSNRRPDASLSSHYFQFFIPLPLTLPHPHPHPHQIKQTVIPSSHMETNCPLVGAEHAYRGKDLCIMVAVSAPRRSARLAGDNKRAATVVAIKCKKINAASTNATRRARKKAAPAKRAAKTKPKLAKSPKVAFSLSRDTEAKYRENFRYVCGIDEAGRGPVVVAACIIEDDVVIDGITDSKATTESSRVASFEQLVAHPGVTYAVIRIEHDEIDDINILQATLKGMRMAAERALQMKAEQVGTSDACTSSGPNVQLAKECMALVDGNRVPPNMPMQAESIIKGDSLVFSIAAASIIAKVTRDRIMIEYDALYPEYGLAQHKGYPTAAHRHILTQRGPCPIHRMSYGPVKSCVNIKPKNKQ